MRTSAHKNSLEKYLFASSNDYQLSNQGSFDHRIQSHRQDLNDDQPNMLDDDEHSGYPRRTILNHDIQLSNNSLLDNDDQHEDMSRQQDLEFPNDNGKSMQFSHAASLIQSKGYELDRSGHLPPRASRSKNVLELLNTRQDQQQKFEEIIKKERKEFEDEINKKNSIIEGLSQHSEELEKENRQLKEKIQKVQNQHRKLIKEYEEETSAKEQLLNLLGQKDIFVKRYSEQLKALAEEFQIKEEELKEKDRYISTIQEELRQYTGHQSGLMDFRSLTPKKTSDRELEQLKREKKGLEQELVSSKQKYEQMIQKLKENAQVAQQQFIKKISSKDRKLKQMEASVEHLSSEISTLNKAGQQLQAAQRARSNIQAKQILAKEDTIKELENRIKSLHQDCKAKEERVRDLILEATEKNKCIQETSQMYKELKIKSDQVEKWMRQRQTQIDKKDKIISMLRNEKENQDRNVQGSELRLKKEVEALRKELDSVVEQSEAIEKEKREKEVQYRQLKSRYDSLSKDYKKKSQQNAKKSVSEVQRIDKLQEMLRDQQEQLASREEIINNLNSQISELRKKVSDNRQLNNKIKILQSRLSRDQGYESSEYDMGEKIEFLEDALREKDIELKRYKSQSPSMKIDCEWYEQEIAEKDRMIKQLTEEMEFKESSLNYLHDKLLQVEREKMEAQAEKKCLHSSFYDTSYDEHAILQQKELEQRNIELQEKCEQYETKIRSLTKKLRDKENTKYYNPESDARFQIAQLKSRIKELNGMLLNRQKMISPETLSQSETVELLLKIVKRVNKSSELISMLGGNVEFRDSLLKMEKELNQQMCY